MRCERDVGAGRRRAAAPSAERPRGARSAPGRRAGPARARATGRRRAGRRGPPGRRSAADAHGHAVDGVGGLRAPRSRVLVGVDDLARRRAARRSARPCGGVRRPARACRAGSSARSRSASASAVASPRGTSSPSTPSRDDVAVAGDVGGDDRRARREGLGEHHAERLAAQRRGARARRPRASAARFVRRRTRARARSRPRASIEQRATPRRPSADDHELGGDAARAAPRRRAAGRAGPCARRPGRRRRSAAARRARARAARGRRPRGRRRRWGRCGSAPP